MTKVIAIAGGSGSGKTTLANLVAKQLGPERCTLLAQDRYYRDQSYRFSQGDTDVNFDHPTSVDFDLLACHLDGFRRGHTANVPSYDFATHTRLAHTEAIAAPALVLLEGILILSRPEIRAHIDHSAFVEAEEDLRKSRRLSRDTRERGRTPQSVHWQLAEQVLPMHDTFVEPSKAFAEILVDGRDVRAAVDTICGWA